MRWWMFIMWRRRFLVKKFVLQWHLSENCNLKCLHCYQENHTPIALQYEQLENIYNQFKENSDSERTKSIWIVHSDAPTKLEFLIELIKADFKDIQIHVTLESPIIASHTGPDFIALTGYGK